MSLDEAGRKPCIDLKAITHVGTAFYLIDETIKRIWPRRMYFAHQELASFVPHQLSTPFQNVRATIGALDLTTDGMPHCLFDDRVRESRNLLRPCPERCPEAVGGDRPSPSWDQSTSRQRRYSSF